MTKKVSHQLKKTISSFLVCSVENPFVLSFLYFLMAEFVKLSIFGTVFEVTTRFVIQSRGMWKRLQPRSNRLFNIRYVDLQPVGMGAFGLVWYDIMKRICFLAVWELYTDTTRTFSSAKDQLTGTNVAVKKIMKPFSTPVLSKRTYRELKLLKGLNHENVWNITEAAVTATASTLYISQLLPPLF